MIDYPITKSVLMRAVLSKYVDCSYGKYWYDDMVDAFEREAVGALSLAPSDSVDFVNRREQLRPFLIKLLLYIGVSSEFIPITAKIIETLTLQPRLELNTVLSVAACQMEITEKALSHRLDRCFNIYDLDMFERISYLTRTEPQTPKDALVDLSSYVRVVFFTEVPLP